MFSVVYMKKKTIYKNIRIHKETYDKLKKHKKKNESFNKVIYKIIKNKRTKK